MAEPAALQVAPQDWLAQLSAQVAAGFPVFEFLTAVDRPDAQQIEVVAGLRALRAGAPVVLLATTVDRDAPRLPSAAGLLPGANWAEREVAEMFGVVFTDHPDPRPLLLEELGQWPLRRSFALAPRLAARWPGIDDPADQPPAGVATRRRSTPAVPGNNLEWQP